MKNASALTPRDLNMGEVIAARLHQLGMSKAEFARRINTSRQNASLILARTSHNTELLWVIGQALEFDPFVMLSKALQADCPEVAPSDSPMGQLELKVQLCQPYLAQTMELMMKKLLRMREREVS